MYKPIKDYDDTANVWGDPQIYGNLELYPIKVYDSEIFNCVSVLTIHKNSLGEPDFIRMPYLKFILLMDMQYEPVGFFSERLIKLLTYVFRSPVEIYYSLDIGFPKLTYEDFDFGLIRTEEDSKKLKFYIKVKDEFIVDSNFNNVLTTILMQNDVPFDTIGITDPKLYETLEKAREMASSKTHSATFNERILAYRVLTGVPYKDIKEMTFYQLNKELERAVLILDYKTLYPLEKKGEISFKDSKDSIKHWLEHIKSKGLYDDYILDADPILNKISKSLSGK